MVEIQRQSRRSKSIPLVSLIDVVFQLLIYFMLTTSFTKTESLELMLPPNNEPGKPLVLKDTPKTLHIYISDMGETFIEHKSMSEEQMSNDLHDIFAADPECGVLVLSANKVSVQLLVRVMDRVYRAGGKNLAVADWVLPPGATAGAAMGGTLPHG